MLYIDAKPGDKISLGRKREHHARTIRFDISWWRSTYGDGAVVLLHQRAGDVDPYPCAITENGSIVEWLITEADTEKPSHYGKYELQYLVNGAVVKSATGTTCVDNALGEAADEPPEPQKWWVDQVLDAGRRAEEAAERADEAAENIAPVENELPTAEEARRGKFCIVPDGDTDKLYICMRIAGAYGWFEFVVDESGGSHKAICGLVLCGKTVCGGKS